MQYDYCTDLQRVYTGKAPTLSVLNEAFGKNITETWLAIQIRNLSEFSGVKDKLDTAQIDMLAKTIIATFHYLKVTELMHFFLLFKSGCAFCTISAHQGKFITCRSKESILREVKQVMEMPGFKGYLSDLGGP